VKTRWNVLPVARPAERGEVQRVDLRTVALREERNTDRTMRETRPFRDGIDDSTV
jgi:hypothetical protein